MFDLGMAVVIVRIARCLLGSPSFNCLISKLQNWDHRSSLHYRCLHIMLNTVHECWGMVGPFRTVCFMPLCNAPVLQWLQCPTHATLFVSVLLTPISCTDKKLGEG